MKSAVMIGRTFFADMVHAGTWTDVGDEALSQEWMGYCSRTCVEYALGYMRVLTALKVRFSLNQVSRQTATDFSKKGRTS